MNALRIIMIGAAASAMLTLGACNRPQPEAPASEESTSGASDEQAVDDQAGSPEESARSELLTLVDSVARIRRDAHQDPSRLPALLAAAGMSASDLEDALYRIAEDAEASALYAIMVGARASRSAEAAPTDADPATADN